MLTVFLSLKTDRRSWPSYCREVTREERIHHLSICCQFILVLERLEVIEGSNCGLFLKEACLGHSLDLGM
jgi:hypothetical protein